MAFRLYVYRLKCLIKDKPNMFWTFLFPIILATFFSMAFSNLYSAEMFHSIKIAVINNEQYENNLEFQTALNEASMSEEENKTKLFDITICSEEEAKNLLDNNDIVGYIRLDEETNLYVKTSGLNQTITKSFLDSYSQITNTVTSLVTSNPVIIDQVIKDVSNPLSFVQVANSDSNPPDLTLNYYYALLAMACLYGCFWGLKEITGIQGDLSIRGARVNVAPIHKMKLLLCNMLAALTVHFFGILILLGYLIFGLKLDFSDNFNYVIFTCFIGSLLGISFGSMISVVVKKGEGLKNAVMSAVVMFGCFLAGLMMVQMKYIIATNVPIVQYINPAHLIVDAFYSLYYYDTFDRFYLNITIMVGYCVIFSIITYLATRRRQYASI